MSNVKADEIPQRSMIEKLMASVKEKSLSL